MKKTHQIGNKLGIFYSLLSEWTPLEDILD